MFIWKTSVVWVLSTSGCTNFSKGRLLVSSRCCNKIPQMGGFNNTFIPSQFWRLGSPKSRCHTIQIDPSPILGRSCEPEPWVEGFLSITVPPSPPLITAARLWVGEFSSPFLAVTDVCLVSVQDLGPKWVPCPSAPREQRAFASICPVKCWIFDSAMGQEDFVPSSPTAT